MVSIIDINNDIKEPNFGCQNCNINQILVFGECLKASLLLFTRIIIWVNCTILNYIGTRTILPVYEGFFHDIYIRMVSIY